MGSNMNRLGVMACNLLFIAILLICFAKLSGKSWALLTIALMGIGEFCIHLSLAIASLKRFSTEGQVCHIHRGS